MTTYNNCKACGKELKSSAKFIGVCINCVQKKHTTLKIPTPSYKGNKQWQK